MSDTQNQPIILSMNKIIKLLAFALAITTATAAHAQITGTSLPNKTTLTSGNYSATETFIYTDRTGIGVRKVTAPDILDFAGLGPTDVATFGGAILNGNLTVTGTATLSTLSTSTGTFSTSFTATNSLFLTTQAKPYIEIQMDANTQTLDLTPRCLLIDSVDPSNHGNHIELRRAHGTRGSKTAVQSGDYLFGTIGYGYDGTNYVDAVSFGGLVNGTVATGTVPGMAFIWTRGTDGGVNRLNVSQTGVAIGMDTNAAAFGLHVSGASKFVAQDNYSSDTAAAAFIGRKARGTYASPTAALADDFLVSLVGRGYTASSQFSAVNASTLGFLAAENFTSTGQGTYFTLGVTPISSTTRVERMRITATGNLGLGTTTPNSTLHVAGSFASNIRATASSGNITTTDHVVTGTGAITLTLPTAVSFTGREYILKNIGGVTMTAGSAGGTIDAATTQAIISGAGSGSSMKFKSDGTNWLIID